MMARFREKFATRAENEVVAAVVKHAEGKQEIVLFDVLRKLAEDGVLRSLQQKLEVNDRDRRGLVWATAWDDFRLLLKGFHGWEDASPTVGHLRRSA